MLDYILNSPKLQLEDKALQHKLGHIVPFAATEIITSEIKSVTH